MGQVLALSLKMLDWLNTRCGARRPGFFEVFRLLYFCWTLHLHFDTASTRKHHTGTD